MHDHGHARDAPQVDGASGAPPSRSRATASALGVAFVCAIVAATVAIDPAVEAFFDYRRTTIASGSLYRLLTAHVVHLSTAHAVLDVAGLLLVAWIFAGELSARRMLIVTLAAVVSIDASLWFLHPEIERYAGLSGVLHGWFAAGVVGWMFAGRRTDAFVAKRMWGVALMTALVIKLMIEQRGQAFWLDADAMHIVTSAHRWGAAAGALCAAGLAIERVFRRRDARANGAS